MVEPAGPHLETIDRTAVEINDEFWSPWVTILQETMLEHVYDEIEAHGRIENFRIAAGREQGSFNGRFYVDSDVYKWLEAASNVLAVTDDPTIHDRVTELVDLIADAQADDGYLNTYFMIEEPEKRWTNLHQMHELFCAGHLFEAAVAHHQATGDAKLLTVACKFADHIDRQFGPDADPGVPGHQEIELALVKLYRETAEDRYLTLAQNFIDRRGQEACPFPGEALNPDGRGGNTNPYVVDDDGNYDGTYLQDHAPVREQQTVEGHAVRALYMYTGKAEVAKETGDMSLYQPLEDLWKNMTQKRMYVTGGLGSSHVGERFTEDYDLPNDTAYAETCAAHGSIIWNQRMLELTGDSKYGDLLERTLYNAFLPGVSLDGERYFYVNPLEADGDGHPLNEVDPQRFTIDRQPWFNTPCCPTNVPRLLATLTEHLYLVSEAEQSIYTNLYVGNTAAIPLAGQVINIDQETSLPWEGEVSMTVDVKTPIKFTLYLRLPEWAKHPVVSVNGETIEYDTEDGYIPVTREWTGVDEVTLTLDIPPRFVTAHPAVDADRGQIALERGPLVYCFEETDNSTPFAHISLPEAAEEVSVTPRPDLLGGVNALETTAYTTAPETWRDVLYRDVTSIEEQETTATAIPYYTWGNRDGAAMRIWMPRSGR